jgi:hypothetical protein
MYEHYQKEEVDRFKIKAAMFGAKFDEEEKKKEDDFTFKDPKEYAKLSDKERKALTDKMIDKHKKWAGGVLKK